MKNLLVTLLSCVGALAILVAAAVLVSSWMIPSNYDVATKEFGTPESMASILELYALIEKNPHDPKLEIVEDYQLENLRVRNIPKSFLPKRFVSRWGQDLVGKSAMGWDYVLAYYGEDDRLQGIEFRGSRYGCYASRDAAQCPPRYSSLHRISEQPLYIAIRLTSE